MSHSTWIHRVARVGVKPLVNTQVTPNQLTTLRLVSGLCAAALFAVNPDWNLYAALIFILGMILDRADGELARMSGKTSSWGHTYDLVSDGLCNSLVFVGIGIGLWQGAFGLWAPLMGMAAGLAVGYILWLVLQLENLEGHRAAELGAKGGFDADDGMIAIPIAVLLGWVEPLLVAASIGAPLFALVMFGKFHGKLSTAKERV